MRLAQEHKSSISRRRESFDHQNKAKPAKNIFSSLFEDTKQSELDEDDEDIPDFYHLPRINLNELTQLFKEGRQKYELLKKTYISEKQQVTSLHFNILMITSLHMKGNKE